MSLKERVRYLAIQRELQGRQQIMLSVPGVHHETPEDRENRRKYEALCSLRERHSAQEELKLTDWLRNPPLTLIIPVHHGRDLVFKVPRISPQLMRQRTSLRLCQERRRGRFRL